VRAALSAATNVLSALWGYRVIFILSLRLAESNSKHENYNLKRLISYFQQAGRVSASHGPIDSARKTGYNDNDAENGGYEVVAVVCSPFNDAISSSGYTASND
jgi:hypothetical protein